MGGQRQAEGLGTPYSMSTGKKDTDFVRRMQRHVNKPEGIAHAALFRTPHSGLPRAARTSRSLFGLIRREKGAAVGKNAIGQTCLLSFFSHMKRIRVVREAAV